MYSCRSDTRFSGSDGFVHLLPTRRCQSKPRVPMCRTPCHSWRKISCSALSRSRVLCPRLPIGSEMSQGNKKLTACAPSGPVEQTMLIHGKADGRSTDPKIGSFITIHEAIDHFGVTANAGPVGLATKRHLKPCADLQSHSPATGKRTQSFPFDHFFQASTLGERSRGYRSFPSVY